MTWPVLILVFWIVPIVVAYFIGHQKHRPGAAYGLLGWLGVLILVFQKPSS